MPRRRPNRANENSDTEEEFQTPSLPKNATNYSFEYSSRNNRFVNPNQPSTSAAAREKYYARKSTSTAPKAQQARMQQQSDSNVDSSPERRSTRNNTASAPAAAQQNLRSQRNPSRQPPQNRRKQRKPMALQDRMRKEIRRLQEHSGFLIPRAPFSRLLREVMHEASSEVRMLTRTALEGIQEACETYLVQVLTDAYALTLHRGRVTLMPKDIQLLRIIRLIE